MNKELEEYYKNLLTTYLFKKLNIKNYEKKLEIDYKDILILNNNSNYYELSNNIYLNKLNNQELEYLKNNYLKKNNYNQELEIFISNTYQKVLRHSLTDNYKIYYESDIVDLNSFIDDGVIIFKIYYKEKINGDIKDQLIVINKLINKLNELDKEMSKVLGNSIKTIYKSKLNY